MIAGRKENLRTCRNHFEQWDGSLQLYWLGLKWAEKWLRPSWTLMIEFTKINNLQKQQCLSCLLSGKCSALCTLPSLCFMHTVLALKNVEFQTEDMRFYSKYIHPCLYILSPLELSLSFSSSTGVPGENGLAGEMGHTGKMGPIGEKGINNGNSF